MARAAKHSGGAAGQDLLLHAALGSMPYGFTIWNEQLRLVLWNNTYLEMYHLPAARIWAGMTLRDIAEVSGATGDHGELSAEQIHALYQKRFRPDGIPFTLEHRVRDRDIRSTTTRMPGLGWVVTHQDITEEAEHNALAAAREQALAQQNLRFDAAVNNMSHGLAMFGADMRLIICNSAFAALYSLPPEIARPGTLLADLLRYRVEHGLVPDGERAPAYVARRLKFAGEHQRAVRFIERERGRTISVIQQPMPDGGWVSTHQDITEQQRKEELIQARTVALEVQNMRFDAAINNMLHGLSMFDTENRLIVCNRQYAELYGLPEKLTRPGTSFWDMLDDGQRTGMVSIADPTARRTVLEAVIRAARPFKDNVKMENGRVIAVLHQPMVGGWISTHEDVTEQHTHEEMIRHLARHDALTDLPNRVLFGEEMAKIEARIKRRENIAVLCVDLDNFKTINDSFGHAVGDSVLITVANRLRDASRETDIVARMGGDEFAVVAGSLDDPKLAALIAGRIVKALAEPMTIEDKQIEVGASVGIAMAPVDGTDAETLLRNADLALYRAKSDGRGTYHFFEPEMDEALKLRRMLELGLKVALERGEFRLVFQPVLGLSNNRICGLEALLRWDHPQRGPIPPSEFIPIAEETGMISAIGEWVLAEACRTAAYWPDDVRIAVNLSSAQFKGQGVIEAVERAVRSAGLAPERLELEITEALLLADPNAMFKSLHRLRELGVRIVMDDFGTGYGSLSYLRTFPFDKLKIDRSFIAELSGTDESTAVVNAIIGLSRALGIAVAAEGVETEVQLETVRRQGCDEAQGFLFSPPLPASGIDALLGTVRASAARRLGAAG
ncbi:MAG: PAS-domain containing protein [Devosia sp.]|nr:PAS-domain containing protein [Devosia sp.]